MVDGFLPASKVVELFDGDAIAPGAGRIPYIEKVPEGRVAYYPGGSMEVGALNKAIAEAGPSGLQVGGRRSRRRSRRSRRSSTRQKNKRNRSRRHHK